MISLEKQLIIHMAVMGAFDNFKHHKEITSRCKKYFQEALPGYTIYVDKSSILSNKFEISIWGKDISHNDKYYIGFYSGDNWQEKFLEEMDRLDPRDQIERINQEKNLYAELEYLENEVYQLQDKINERRANAIKMINDLPIPSSAKTRNSQTFWDRPSRELKEKFPNLFKT